MAAEPIQIGDEQRRKLEALARELGNGATPSDLANQAVDAFATQHEAAKTHDFWVPDAQSDPARRPLRSLDDLRCPELEDEPDLVPTLRKWRAADLPRELP